VSILIAYRTRYGTTERYARLLAERLPGESRLADLRHASRLSPGDYGLILLGSPIYGGTILPGLGSFCERHREELLSRPVGLFICCLYEGERARAQLDSAFPDWLSLHAFGRWVLGGEVRLDRLNLLDRFLVRRLIRVQRDIAKMRPEAVDPIARRVAEVARGGEGSP
jgi:menaquinone-dependent protoporphyrinogen oxidase